MTIVVGWLLLSTGCSIGFVAGSAFGRGLWSFGGCAEPRGLDEPLIERRAIAAARNKLDNSSWSSTVATSYEVHVRWTGSEWTSFAR